MSAITQIDQRIAILDELVALAQRAAAAGPIASVGAALPITSTGGANPVIGINPATDAMAGSLSAADKTKLDGLTPGAAVASVGVTAPILNTGSATAPVIAISPATDVAAGSMSAADKTKLDALSASEVTAVTASQGLASSGGATPNITPAAGFGLVASVANAAALTALVITGFPVGTTVFCGVPGASTPSFCAYFTLVSSTGLTPNAATIIASSNVSFVWVRTVTGVAALAAQQTAWFVDPAAGNDENTGLLSGTAVQTKAEIKRRWGTWSPILDGINVVITYVTAEAAGGHDPGLFTPVLLNGATLLHTAALPATSFTGTLLAVTAKNRGTNTALQSTFTTTTGAMTANLLLINATRGNSRAFAQRNVSGGTWQITQPHSFSGVPLNDPNVTAAVNTWANGDAISGYSLLSVDLAVLGGTLVEFGNALSHGVYQIRIVDPDGAGTQDPILVDGACYPLLNCCQVDRSLTYSSGQLYGGVALGCAFDQPGAANGAATGVGVPFIIQGGYVAGLYAANMVIEDDVIVSATSSFADCSIPVGLFVDTGVVLSVRGFTSLTGPVYGPGTFNVKSGVATYTGVATTALPVAVLQLNGIATGYSNATSGTTTVHGGITLTAAHLDAAAGAAGFGGYAYGGGATLSQAGIQP